MVARDQEKKLEIIGSTEYITLAGVKKVPAKIDTGADSSSVWATQINMDKDGVLSFVLFGEKSPVYTGEVIHSKEYVARIIRSSHGDEQIRYRVKLPLVINGKEFVDTFTLANRARNHFPVLIGRKTLENRFLVDVSRVCIERPIGKKQKQLNQELQKNPYEFHQKYLKRRKGVL